MKLLFFVIFLSLTTLFGSDTPNILEHGIICEKNSNFEMIYVSHDLNTLKEVDRFFSIRWQPKHIHYALENKTFGVGWKGYSTERKLTEILQNYINQKKNGQDIIFNVPLNASYQRCMRTDFLENLSRKNDQLSPEPNFDRLRVLMNMSYQHSMHMWTLKSVEKNYNKVQDSIPDEIQEVFKSIKKYYIEEVKNYIKLFFAKIDPKEINFTELEESSKFVISLNLVKNIRNLYELITDFADVRSGDFKNENRRADYSYIITTDTLIKYIAPEKYSDIQKRKDYIKQLKDIMDTLDYQSEAKRWNF